MNRPRRENESYEDYKKNLKATEKALKRYLRGRLIYNSRRKK